MPSLTLDTLLFSLFLLSTLTIGVHAGRRVKNIRQYAIGDKNFSTGVVTFTIVTTWIGCGFLFFNLQNIYTGGLKFIIVAMGGPLCFLLIGEILAVRMGEFLNNLSVAEAMGELYGKSVRIITAISGVALGIGVGAIQFKVLSNILSIIWGIEGIRVTMAAASIVVIYSAFGGLRSVAITHLFHFITFSLIIPILAYIIWAELKDTSLVFHTLTTNPIFSFRKTVGWNSQFLDTISLMLFFMIPGMHPATFQRIAIAKNTKQAQKSNIYSAVLVLLLTAALAWVAILLLTANPNLDPKKLIDYIMDTYAYAYPGLKGIIAVCIAATAMSTADAHLNASAVLINHDIIKLLKPSFQESMISIKLFSAITGILAILLSLYQQDLLELVLLGASFYMPIVSVPLLLAILGFRSSTRAVLLGMVAGLVTVLVWNKYFAYIHVNEVIAGMVANFLFLLGSHYLLKEKGGWVGIKDLEPLLAARQARRDAWNAFFNAIKHPKLKDYLVKNLPNKEKIYSLFALYVFGVIYASFFFLPESIVTTYRKLYDFIVYSVLISTTFFITYPAWPSNWKGKKIIAFAWPLGISYILFVVGTFLVVMSGFDQVQMILFILNLVIGALLIDWPLMLVLVLGGILCAIGTFKLYIGYVPLDGVSSILQFKVIYGIPVFLILLIAIIKSRQAKKELAAQNAYLLSTTQESRKQLNEVLAYRDEILSEFNDQDANLLDSTVASIVQQAIYRITDYLRLEVSEVNLDELIGQVKASLKLKNPESQFQLIIKKHTQVKTIQADLAKIKQLLVESICYIDSYNSAHRPITIVLEDTKLGHQIDHIRNYTRRLDAIRISITTEKVHPSTDVVYRLDMPQSISKDKLELAENIRIIDAHYGYADISQPTTHIYVIPTNVREVRGKVMELLREPAAACPEELAHPLAIHLEKELINKLKGTQVNLAVIKKALDMIKKYHGGVKRKSGEPFFTHPISVALIMMDYSQDQDAIVAALLHDTVEDTSLSLAHIRAMFGETVAFLVGKATNLQGKLRRLSLRDHENIHRLMNYEDKRAAFVKLADRLHNMRTIQWHSSLKKQQQIAEETLNFFVPMAKYLDLTAISQELEELSLQVLNP